MNFLRIVLVALFLLVLSGCGGTSDKLEEEQEEQGKEIVEELVEAPKKEIVEKAKGKIPAKEDLSSEAIPKVTKTPAINLGDPDHKFPVFGLKTNTAISEIDLDQILHGGPGKDGIPAIDNPKFVSIDDAKISDEILGILLDINGEKRYYPYNILVWHEIVNDTIAGRSVAVTFCPLCGSAIVFDRNIDGEVRRFGVSGLLYESNLLMYDDKNESLWSQAIGKAVVGDDTGLELVRVPMQLINFAELKQKHKDAQVLSENTGHRRNYTVYPYGDYEESSRLVFPTSVQDKRFFEKEIMYVVNVGDKSVAFVYDKIPEGESTVKVEGKNLTVIRDSGEVIVKGAGVTAGYFEMWFSWATHHQEDGVVVDEF